jgi:RNA polymerase sigma factor (sigma-70 family)
VENHIVIEKEGLNLAVCTHLVGQYLVAQSWQLVEPADLAEAIFVELGEQVLARETAVHAVQTQVWQRYAAILHQACCQPGTTTYERAWQELDGWLRRQRQHLPWHHEDREDVVQETLSDLQTQLAKKAIKAPRAFLMYALQALRNTARDMERRRTAVFRGGDHDPLSWEALQEETSEEPVVQSELGGDSKTLERRVENTVSDHEVRAKLKTFFAQHLSSEQQLFVAELHFLDGLDPKEIAGLLHKQPHEIRMIKFRIVQTLRGLPASEQQKLLALLDQEAGGETNAP